MPAEDFIPIARIEKVQLSAANGNNYHAQEILWTNCQTYEKLPSYMKETGEDINHVDISDRRTRRSDHRLFYRRAPRECEQNEQGD